MSKKTRKEITKELTKRLISQTEKIGTFGALEVTIGFQGKERVDYITMDTKGIFRFYEIKSSLADFNSKASHTFLGHYNYYVMTDELFEKVKDKIPKHIGVCNMWGVIKNPKKQKLGIEPSVIKDSMIRSLSRDASKYWFSDNQLLRQSLNSQKRSNEALKKNNRELEREISQIERERRKERRNKKHPKQ